MKFNAEWDAAEKCLPIKITMFFLILLFRQRLWGVVFRWEQSERADVQLAFLVRVITELPMAQTRWQPLLFQLFFYPVQTIWDSFARNNPGRLFGSGSERTCREKSIIKEIRGLGLMKGIELSVPAKPYIEALQKEGILVIPSGTNVIRLLPPLILEEEHVNILIQVLDSLF